MKEEKDKLRDFMKEALYDYEITPDPKDWNRIAKTLHKGTNKRYILWAIIPLAASLLILITLYTGGVLSHSDNTSTSIADNLKKQAKQSVTSTLNTKLNQKDLLKSKNAKRELPSHQPSETTQLNKVKPVTFSHNRVDKNAIATNHHKNGISQSGHLKNDQSFDKVNQQTTTPATKSNLLANNQLKQSRRVSSDNALAISTVLPDESLNTMQNSNLLVHSVIPRPIELIKNKTKPLHYNELDLFQKSYEGHLSGNTKDELAYHVSTIRFKGLALSNSSGMQMQTSSDNLSYSGTFASKLTSSMYLNSVKVLDNALKSSPNIGDLFQNKKRDYTPPLTFGLNVNLSLPGNWSIETGIQYTNLRSKGVVTIESTNEVRFVTNNKYKVDESLQYIGVPFNIDYAFYNRRKTMMYISTGFSIEKGIDAKYTAVSQDNIPGLLPICSHNSIQGLQFSVNSGIGISYKFISHFELFTQPSVTYYIHSQNNSTNIYSVHPWLFNLRSGIRYTLK